MAYQPIKRREVFHDKTIQAIVKAHDATAAQVALAWLIHIGALPIPKTTNKDHIDDDLKGVELKLALDEIEKLTVL